jgi:hypothetical protein
MQTRAMTRVVVFDDRVLDGELSLTLAQSGVELLHALDLEAGMRLLRESAEPMTALFWVSLADNTMSGLDEAALLGELLRDEPLARRHAYILVTPTPLDVHLILGRLIDRLHVTTLTAPVDRERLLSALWLATQRANARGATPAAVSLS